MVLITKTIENFVDFAFSVESNPQFLVTLILNFHLLFGGVKKHVVSSRLSNSFGSCKREIDGKVIFLREREEEEEEEEICDGRSVTLDNFEDGLKRLMEIQGSCVEMPKEDFELGHWSSYILHAYGMLGVCEESNQRLSHDGGEIVAQTLEQYLDERGGNFNIDLTRSSQATLLDSSVAALI
ncbi:hypothetical protein G9A89_017124 [Geosiphon pyriformis]|nr:hypothetical protein G9A89_017124 [Geosiphon pyriformis]